MRTRKPLSMSQENASATSSSTDRVLIARPHSESGLAFEVPRKVCGVSFAALPQLPFGSVRLDVSYFYVPAIVLNSLLDQVRLDLSRYVCFEAPQKC